MGKLSVSRAMLRHAAPLHAPIEVEINQQPLQQFASVAEAVRLLRPSLPVFCVHLDELRHAAEAFLTKFPGKSFYAVKCNPQPVFLRALYQAGVRHFDVASLAEVITLRGLFADAHLAFMHTIKAREAIATAYANYGVRDFAADTPEEVTKISEATKQARDVRILVRLAIANSKAAVGDMATKFGASSDDVVVMLRDVAKRGLRVGLCFHVGSQATDTAAYQAALDLAGKVIKAAGVKPSVLDVGGGFPVQYDDAMVAPLEEFFGVIRAGVKRLNLPKDCELWCEPGRALVAAGQTLIARVEQRKGDALYLNDGFYGSLMEVAVHNQRWPVTLMRPDAPVAEELAAFRFYGPSCDCIDKIDGPYLLPNDVREGDWLAFAMHGAYSTSSQTRFNGFYSDHYVLIAPQPAKKKDQAMKAAALKDETRAPATVTQLKPRKDKTVATMPATAEPLDHFVKDEYGNCFAGRHLIVEVQDACPQALADIKHIENMLREAATAAGATLLSVDLHHFQPNGGVSGVAILAESHISIHTWPERGYAALDAFMCGIARPEKSVAVFRRYLKPKAVQMNEIRRGLVAEE